MRQLFLSGSGKKPWEIKKSQGGRKESEDFNSGSWGSQHGGKQRFIGLRVTQQGLDRQP
jgi:hypothetical protein